MTIQIHSFSNSEFQGAVGNFEWDHGDTTSVSELFPGVAVGVSIFGSEIVTSISSGGKNFTFVRADTNGSYRSEIWCCTNIPTSAFTSITINLSGSADIVAGACCYLYLGGVGANAGATGTSTPLAESSIIPTQLNSILFGNICINTTGSIAPTDQNFRWEGISSNNHGLGCDRGPIEVPGTQEFDFQTSGTVTWALSAVELLDYVDNPPAMMGL